MVGFLGKTTNDPITTPISVIEPEITELQLRSKAVLNALDEALILLGLSSEITFINDRAQKLFSLSQVKLPDARALFQYIKASANITENPKFDSMIDTTLDPRSIQSDSILITATRPENLSLRCYTGPIYDDNSAYLGRIWKFTDETHILQLNQAKSEFVTLASHQLKNPLTAICGYLDLMKSGDYGEIPQHLEEPISAIVQSSRHMRQLVSDLMHVTKMESNQLEFSPQVINLSQLVNEAVAEMQISAMNKHINLVFHDFCQTNLVFADPELIREVIENFISNAIKYSPNDRTITATLSDNAQSFAFQLADQGIGVPYEEQERLFQKLYRASNAQQIEGTGLGLYLAKHLIVLHNGQIGFSSIPQRGSTFWFTLPKTELNITENIHG